MEHPSASPPPARGEAEAPAQLPAGVAALQSLLALLPCTIPFPQLGAVLDSGLRSQQDVALPLCALVIFQMLSANVSLALHSHSSPLQLQIPSQ